MNFPDDLKYHEKHLWVKVEGDKATIGLTDYAQDQLKEVVYLELPDEGAEITQGESFGQIESTKAVSEFVSPISGKIVDVNYDILDEPENVNSDPYGAGWLIKASIAKSEEISNLMDASAYSSSLCRK